jgi:hypothetical protein
VHRVTTNLRSLVAVQTAILASLGTACGAANSAGAGAQQNVTLHAGGTPYGFSVEMTVTFSDDRELQSGTFRLDGRSYPAEFYPDDGTDREVQPDPLPLDAGVSVMVSAKVRPDCARPPTPPELVIRSHPDSGAVRVDQFSPANAADYATAVKAWCASTVQATVAYSSISTTGAVTVRLALVNPGARPVTVTSDAYTAGAIQWKEAAVAVPPTGSATLVVTATDGSCRRSQNPWTAGHLRANGRTIPVADGTEWC